MTFRLFLNCIATAVLFSLWQRGISEAPGVFMFSLLGFVLSAIDYAKGKE